MDLSLLATIDLDLIADPGARHASRSLLALIEQLVAENHALRAENQRLKDEIARLKGEQGQPRIRPQSRSTAQSEPAGSTDYSSEGERRTPQPWRKGSKRDALTSTRTERLTVDRATLPADAQFKGIETVVVQDLTLGRDTICFEKEVWYSPSQQRSYQAALPQGYEGQFGPGLKGLALALHFGANVTEAKLLDLFRESGVVVSSGWLSTLLSGDVAGFGAEARAVERAGLASSPWQHLDDTATRVNGQNEHCQVLGNELFTAYHTTPKKDRLTVLDVLRGSTERTYLLKAEADAALASCGLSARARQRLAHLPREQDLDTAAFAEWEQAHGTGLGAQQRTQIREALAIAAYHAQTEWPIVQCLVCDDAPQFRALTPELALCWVHEGRHYTKLTAYVPHNRAALDTFRTQFWEYYRALLTYREGPTAEERARLVARFEALFTPETGYPALDERIALTRAKQDHLLRVLSHPELPLHNNPAELAARRRVRKRDASFGPRSAAGRTAWDTFHTLAATTQQLGVSFLHYLGDRLTQAQRIPPLATLITARAGPLHLGASWAPA